MKDEDIEIADGTVPEFAPAPVEDENEMIKKEDGFLLLRPTHRLKKRMRFHRPRGKQNPLLL